MQRSFAGISCENSPGREEKVDSRRLFEGTDFSRGQAGVRLFRKPALRPRLLRLTSLVVIVVVAIGLWLAAIWTVFAIMTARA
jgi:hypothetical protein